MPPTGTVSINNTAPKQGQTLTASNTLADADGLGTITYQWIAGTTNIGTGKTYALTVAEAGKTITVTASYKDGLGNLESISSAATAAVMAVAGVTFYGDKNGIAKPDSFVGGTGDDQLYGFLLNDILKGGAGKDILDGGDGNDYLDGGSDADVMKGGQGSDTYVVDNTGDVINEDINTLSDVLGNIKDTVQSALPTYTLPDNVENLVLINKSISGKGNSLGNDVTGNDAANTLEGLDGDDVLIGGLGNDKLNGGNGVDTARYQGISTDYKLDYQSGSFKVTDNNIANGNDGIDTLTSIEKLQFSDKTIDTANLNLKTAMDIFKSQLLTTAELQVANAAKDTGMIRSLADFSKAAYALQTWEQGTAYNDVSDNADTAYQDVLSQGWSPLDLGISQVNGVFTYNSHRDDVFSPTVDANTIITTPSPEHHDFQITLQTTNGMAGGYYTNENAAAFVARSGDALVLSFRGTNDNRGDDNVPLLTPDSGVINKNDPNNGIRPDVDQWGGNGDHSNKSMMDHYALFAPLITALNSYVADSNNGINHVYVTGHSLGGAMAIAYMADPNHSSNLYQAVTFAAPAFTITNMVRDDPFGVDGFSDDPRLVQIEVAIDPVPMTWDAGFPQNRPGDVVRFSGDNTLNITEHYAAGTPVWYDGNANNHSMDYYRAIADNVDAASWQTILAQTGDQEVYLGGTRTVSNRVETFTVATNNDTLENLWGTNVFYGGEGNDKISSGSGNELLLGGVGDDTLLGNGGRDNLVGGAGKDTLTGGALRDVFVFNNTADSGAFSTLRDEITDFVSGSDRINLSRIDANTSTKSDDAFSFMPTFSQGHFSGSFTDSKMLFFDTTEHVLYGNNNADPFVDFSILLTGVTSLSTSDFIL